MTVGCQVQSEFTVVQHERNIHIQKIHALKDFFGCGQVCPNHASRKCFKVRKKEDLLTKIIPFFDKYSLKTTKHLDFLKFREVLLCVPYKLKKKILLCSGPSLEGLLKIRKIKSTMNTKGEQLLEPKIESSST